MVAECESGKTRENIVDALRESIRKIGKTQKRGDQEVRSLGCQGLDGLLPDGGMPPGTCLEWLCEDDASGAGVLALTAAHAAAESKGAIVVLDRQRNFYPPAAAALGIELRKLIVIRASTRDDELWAFDQALRCSGVAAVWGYIDKLDQRWSRRLQLAAEQGGGIGHLLRPARAVGWSSWAYAQFLIHPRPTPIPRSLTLGRNMHLLPSSEAIRSGASKVIGMRPMGARRWKVELVRCQGLAPGGNVEVELDEVTGKIRETIHETHSLSMAPELAHSATHCRSAGA